MNLLEVEDLTVSYGKNLVLGEACLQIKTGGKIIGILGPNGAGKSTFLKAILHLCPKRSGRVLFWGKPLSYFQEKVAYVPQKEEIDWEFPITAYEVVLMGRYGQLKFWQKPRLSDKEAALDALRKMGLKGYENHQISELSGGQQQKLFLARAMVQKAEIYFLDEPFQGVDATSEIAMIQMFKEWKEQGKTLFIVHHDLSCLKQYFDELILIHKRIVAYGPTEEIITSENLQRTFGKNPWIFEEASRLQVDSIGKW